jgi:GcrA cell cycle regulator
MNIWTPRKTEQLRELWIADIPATTIGYILGGITKNQVIGRAWRLRLPSRRTKEPSVRTTLDVISLIPEIVEPWCRWPFGYPGDQAFHFCCAAPVKGKPYCEEHCRIAYLESKGTPNE